MQDIYVQTNYHRISPKHAPFENLILLKVFRPPSFLSQLYISAIKWGELFCGVVFLYLCIHDCYKLG